MEPLLTFLLPLLITLSPIILLLILGLKKLRTGKGIEIIATGITSILSGFITPFIAMSSSLYFASVFDKTPQEPKCGEWAVGFIGLGIIVELILVLLAVIIKVVEITKRKKV